MIFYAILHKRTGKLFPHLESGSTYFEFEEPDNRRRRQAFPRPPRLFGNKGLANRYVTEYCKGIRGPNSFASKVEYLDSRHRRSVDDFCIIEVKVDYEIEINEAFK